MMKASEQKSLKGLSVICNVYLDVLQSVLQSAYIVPVIICKNISHETVLSIYAEQIASETCMLCKKSMVTLM